MKKEKKKYDSKKKNKKKSNNKNKVCMNCENCIPIGEGDHICDEHMVMVLEDYFPTEDFLYCGGKDWNER